MSGPRARMGYQLMAIHAARPPNGWGYHVSDDILCEDCDPSRGWGWEFTDEEKDYHDYMKEHPAAMPRASMGYDVKGRCPHCSGNGRVPIPFTEVWCR